MKNLFFTIIILLISSTTCWATEWGLLGGFNYNNGKVETDGETLSISSTLGFQIGIRAYQNLDHIKIRYGLEAKQINLSDDFTFYDDVADEFYNSKIDISNLYVSIPISVLYPINETFSLLGGVGLNILINDKHKIDNVSMNVKYNTLFFSLEIGTLINLTDKILLEASYNVGLMPIYDEVDGKMNTNSFVINAIYLL